MDSIDFHKYEGLGNDFVLIEADREDAVSPALARALCDRRFGVGADGVLLVLPPRREPGSSPSGAEARMRVINADGSVPEMCGNGLRCAVLHLERARPSTSRAQELRVVLETDAGIKPAILEGDTVTVDMGVVRVTGEARLEIEGERWDFVLADAGNPHAIAIRAADVALAERIGPAVENHPRFAPARTNVEIATFSAEKNEIDLIVWERGVGITRACGTGACATVAAAVAKKVFARGDAITVHLLGGDLAVTIRDDDHAMMRGPARHVFSGRVDIATLATHATPVTLATPAERGAR